MTTASCYVGLAMPSIIAACTPLSVELVEEIRPCRARLFPLVLIPSLSRTLCTVQGRTLAAPVIGEPCHSEPPHASPTPSGASPHRVLLPHQRNRAWEPRITRIAAVSPASIRAPSPPLTSLRSTFGLAVTSIRLTNTISRSRSKTEINTIEDRRTILDQLQSSQVQDFRRSAYWLSTNKNKCSPEDKFGTTSTPTSSLGFPAGSLESMGWDVIVMLQAS